MAALDGKDLIGWGFVPGPWFGEALGVANAMRARGEGDEAIRAHLTTLMPKPPERRPLRAETPGYAAFIEPENDDEGANVAQVRAAMDAILRVPTLKAGAIMPDACPTGPNDIPVGGVVAAKNAIHPGFHSADICCSMALTVLERDEDAATVMDAAAAHVHFGPMRRPEGHVAIPGVLRAEVTANPFLKGLEDLAELHFGTQGDGNHFYYVGRLESTGQPAIVSHHGSRGLGAKLYRRGMEAADRHRAQVCPEAPRGMAWIEADTDEGRAYWDALQVVRRWTKASHFAVHDAILARLGARAADRFWNEHNFVFRRDDGRYYHAKGATPSYRGFSADDDGRTLIPMNMAEPILITAHADKAEALGFAPHGAGRNMSRSRFLRENAPALPEGIDVRFHCGIPDLSELPQAYKSAAQVTGMIEKHGLARVQDRVLPYGSIMAGDWERDAPWRKKREAKKAQAKS